MIFILQSWISKVVQSDETQADAPIIASYNDFLDLTSIWSFQHI